MIDNILVFLDLLNLPIPVSIDRCIDAVDNSFSNAKVNYTTEQSNQANHLKDENIDSNKNSNRKSKIHLFIMIFIVICLIVQFGLNFKSDDSKMSAKMIFTTMQCELVKSDIKALFWEYTSTHEIKEASDFSNDDQKKLKTDFWKIIKKNRLLFSHAPQGIDVMNEVSHVYDYEKFSKHFDSFFEEHKTGSLKNFELEFIEYIEKIQSDITDEVFLNSKS